MKYTFPVFPFISVFVFLLLQTAPSLADTASVIAEKVPEKDPASRGEIKILDEMKRVHPRLVLSQQEFSAFYQAAETDPLVATQVKGIMASVPSKSLNMKNAKRLFNSASAALIYGFDGWLTQIVIAHGLNPTPESRQACIDLLTLLVETPYWEEGGEMESGMQMGAVATLAGLTFDVICNDLEPDFRKKAAETLFQHARNQYYLGHLKLAPWKVKYWQADPQNNHRWHRNSGLVSCLLAVADEPGIDAGWMLEQVKAEMDFVMKWLPEEGDNHESVTYSQFGFAHLAVAALMMDRVLGTSYLQHPGIQQAWKLQVYSYSPARHSNLSYGDTNNRPNRKLSKSGAFFVGPKVSRDPDAQAAMLKLYDWIQEVGDSPQISWLFVPFYDPTLKPGRIENLPLSTFFEDLGLAYFRDSWQEDATLLMYKCGPYGGFKLNEFRNETEKPGYISVAHDDPDANTFSFVIDGEIIPHGSGYEKPKRTDNHNTWVVNGQGQKGEGRSWTQPPSGDLTQLAYPTAWLLKENGISVVEGEAGGSYPDLNRYRRTLVWLPGQYVLILDDLVAEGEAQMAWNAVAEKAEFIQPAEGLSALLEGEVKLDYQILGNQPLQASIKEHLTLGKKKYQLQSTRYMFNGNAVKTATLLNPWNLSLLEMTFVEEEGGTVNLTIQHPSGQDVWQWQSAPHAETPSTLTGTRGEDLLLKLSSENAVHP